MPEIRPHSVPDVRLRKTDWKASDVLTPSLTNDHRRRAAAGRLIEVRGGGGGF